MMSDDVTSATGSAGASLEERRQREAAHHHERQAEPDQCGQAAPPGHRDDEHAERRGQPTRGAVRGRSRRTGTASPRRRPRRRRRSAGGRRGRAREVLRRDEDRDVRAVRHPCAHLLGGLGRVRPDLVHGDVVERHAGGSGLHHRTLVAAGAQQPGAEERREEGRHQDGREDDVGPAGGEGSRRGSAVGVGGHRVQGPGRCARTDPGHAVGGRPGARGSPGRPAAPPVVPGRRARVSRPA